MPDEKAQRAPPAWDEELQEWMAALPAAGHADPEPILVEIEEPGQPHP